MITKHPKIIVTHSLLFLAIFVALHSCVFHPPYRNPDVEIPEQWRFSCDNENVVGNLQWWTKFEDSTLDALVAEALEYNKELKVAVCRVAEFYANLSIVRSELYPQLGMTTSATKQEQSLGALAISAPVAGATEDLSTFKRITDLFSLTLSLSYEIDVWGRIQSATEVALAQFLAQEQVRRGVLLTLVGNVATAYFQLREYDAELAISKKTFDSYVGSYELAKFRFDEGLTSELEVKQAESLIEVAAGRIALLEGSISRQENLISILIGRVPSDIVRQKDLTAWPIPKKIPVGLPAELLQQRPDILQAEQQLIAANAQIGVARAAYFPRISLTGLFGFESLALKNLFKPTSRWWQYGAEISEPLFTGWRIASTVEQAEAMKCTAYYQYENVVLNAFKEVEDALVSHRKALELAAIEKKRVAVLEEYLDLANLQYNEGYTDYLNVLDAQRNLFNAQLELSAANSSVYITLVDIYKALGGAWIDELDI